MLSLETVDDWTSIAVDFDDGFGAQTWSPAATVLSAYDALEDLRLWLDATFAGELSSWGWGVLNAGATFLITTTNAYDVTNANAAAESIMGFDNAYPPAQMSIVGVGRMAGTWEPAANVAVRRWFASPLFDGDPAGVGYVGGIVGATSVRRPKITAVATGSESARLAEVAARASHPRRAALYDYFAQTWRDPISVGRIRRQRAGFGGYRIDFEALA